MQKLKEDEDGIEMPFGLKRVTIGIDRDGDDVTTCVITMGQPQSADRTPPPGPEPRASPNGKVAFGRSLLGIFNRHSQTVSRFRKIPKDARVLRQADLGTFDEIEINAANQKSRVTQINRHVGALVDDGLLARHSGYLWVVDRDGLTMDREIS